MYPVRLNLNLPSSVVPLITKLEATLKTSLGENLEGMYLHGSLAMGCFKEDSSDIDIVAVIKRRLSIEVKQELNRVMIEVSDILGKNIELSIVTQTQLGQFQYPTPIEFQFSDDTKEKFQNGELDLQVANKSYDLAAHLVIAKNFGVSLVGPDASTIFPDIPKPIYLDSIARDSEWSYNRLKNGEHGYCRVPKYAVLNYCRVLALIEADQITSKESGAEWGLKNLPAEFKPIIAEAFKEYQKAASSLEVDGKLLKKFNEYAFGKIKAARASRG